MIRRAIPDFVASSPAVSELYWGEKCLHVCPKIPNLGPRLGRSTQRIAHRAYAHARPRTRTRRRRHAWGAGLLASSSWRWQHCSDDRRFQGHKWSRRVRQLPLSSSLQRTDCIYVAEQARKFYSCASSCCSGCADFEKPSPSCLLRLRRTASLGFGHELKCTTLIGA